MDRRGFIRFVFLIFVFVQWSLLSYADKDALPTDTNIVITNSFWDNWYGQVGVDM